MFFIFSAGFGPAGWDVSSAVAVIMSTLATGRPLRVRSDVFDVRSRMIDSSIILRVNPVMNPKLEVKESYS